MLASGWWVHTGWGPGGEEGTVSSYPPLPLSQSQTWAAGVRVLDGGKKPLGPSEFCLGHPSI